MSGRWKTHPKVPERTKVAPGPEVDPTTPVGTARDTSEKGALSITYARGPNGFRKAYQVLPIGPDLIVAAIKNAMHSDLIVAA